MRFIVQRTLCVLLVCLCAGSLALAQTTPFNSEEEERVLRGWDEQPELPVSLVRAMLLAEGVTEASAASATEGFIEEVFREIDDRIRERHSAEKKAKIIFKHLHREVLRRYDEDAQLSDLRGEGRFNCVTGTALFYLAAQRHGVPVALYVTPVHVYAVADPAGADVRIEITDPRKGFDFDDERDDVIEHMLTYKMITPEEVDFQGEDAIYRAFIEDEWLIQPEALVGIVYNNEAALRIAEEEYEAAAAAYEKALMVEPDRESYRQGYAGALALAAYAHSTEPDLVAPLINHALEVRRGDALFAEAMLPVVQQVAVQLVVKRAFEKAVEIVRLARTTFPETTEADEALQRLEAGIHYDWGMSMMRRGDYEASWEKSRAAYQAAPEEDLFREGYVFASCQYASRFLEQGELDVGLDVLSGLTDWIGEYPIVGETYARLIFKKVVEIVFAPRVLAEAELIEVRTLVEQAQETAPDQPALREAMSLVYHEEAMSKIRANDYRAAATLVEEGLGLNPDHQLLREAQDLLEASR